MLEAIVQLARQPAEKPVAVLFAAAFLLYALLSWWIRDDTPVAGFKIIRTVSGDWFFAKAKARWGSKAAYILKQGAQETNNKPFQVVTKVGPVVVLPMGLCDEVRNDTRFSFTGFNERQGMTQFPGLDVVHTGSQGDIIQDVVRKNLTQSLNFLTQPLSSEAATVVREQLPESEEWKDTKFLFVAVQIAARLSALVFLGEKLCHDEKWIQVSIQFAIVTLKAQDALRAWPVFMRSLVHRFLPTLHYQRALIQKARAIISPELEARRAARKSVLRPQDSLSWLDDVRGDREFDVLSGQLMLTMAAIHTTSAVITGLMWDLVPRPELVSELRQEIVRVLEEDGGWKKTSLQKMKLLDSCMRESQRMNILGPLALQRRVEEDVTLTDGTFLRKGTFIGFPTYHMRSKELYENPNTFDGHRFLRMRQNTGEENKWQFVSTSTDYLSFGHGKHACPGRFFASNEIKIAIAHLLIKYDWTVVGDGAPRSREEFTFMPDPEGLVAYRSRTPEMIL